MNDGKPGVFMTADGPIKFDNVARKPRVVTRKKVKRGPGRPKQMSKREEWVEKYDERTVTTILNELGKDAADVTDAEFEGSLAIVAREKGWKIRPSE